MKTLIVGSGSLTDMELMKKHYAWADLVIAVDGGLLYLDKAGLLPHVLLGDFDSLPGPSLKKAKSQKSIELVTFPPEKDFTDMELAMNLALERGATELVILGGSGTRLDHTTANIHLLYKTLKCGVKSYIEDEHNQIFLIDKSIIIHKRENSKVSLLPLPPFVKGLTTTGLSYPLVDETLVFGISRGISNEFADQSAGISIKEGLLLIFISKD